VVVLLQQIFSISSTTASPAPNVSGNLEEQNLMQMSQVLARRLKIGCTHCRWFRSGVGAYDTCQLQQTTGWICVVCCELLRDRKLH